MQIKLVILKAMKTFTVLQTIHICFICIVLAQHSKSKIKSDFPSSNIVNIASAVIFI